METTEPTFRSTLHANCGCSWQSRAVNPLEVIRAAARHTVDTGHTVQMLGELRLNK